MFDLPITSSSSSQTSLHLLRPIATFSPNQAKALRSFDGRASPDTVFSERSELDIAYYNAEPVVEWCMHNQRLRSTVIDVFSLPKGRDLLSSAVWSPDDNENIERTENQHEPSSALNGDEVRAMNSPKTAGSPERDDNKASASRNPIRSNWSRPYLKNDSPEWTDMTCTLRMAHVTELCCLTITGFG